DIDSGSFTKEFTALAAFSAVSTDLSLSKYFVGRISIWVIGPKEDDELAAWQAAIAEVCTETKTDGTVIKPEMMTLRLYLPGSTTIPAPDASRVVPPPPRP